MTEQKSAAIAAAEVKNAELEAALAQALERIKSADVASQGVHERISGLEKKNLELVAERQQLQSKVCSFGSVWIITFVLRLQYRLTSSR